MSQTSSGFTDPQQQQYGGAQSLLEAGYIPSEEEKRIFRECKEESFWYRSLPLSAAAMAVTQVLVSRGTLTPSPRFGSLPKVAFAAAIGYIGGKISYAKICQEKFKNLENSPLGEALRKGQQHLPHHSAPQSQSEMGDPNQMTFDPALQSVTEPQFSGDSFSDPSSSTYQPAAFGESAPAPAGDYINPQEPSYLDEEMPRRKAILYEDLRSRNRENYEVTMTQKADTLSKAPAEVPAPRKDVKKNQYGDAWDE